MSEIDSRSALLVHDLQKGIMPMLPPQAQEELIGVTTRLVQAFRAAGRPVVWIHATGLPGGRVERPIPEPEELPADFSELDERLPALDGDLHIHKQRTWSAFPGTPLQERLQEQGITQVVITGVATGAGVDSTARSAYDAGFTVTVVSDACLDGNPARHAATLADDVPSYGNVLDSHAALTALAQR